MRGVLMAAAAGALCAGAAQACDLEAYGAAAFMAAVDTSTMSEADIKAAEAQAMAAYREQQMNIARANMLSRYKFKLDGQSESVGAASQ